MNIPQSRDNLAVVSSQRSLTPTRMAPFFMNYNAQKSIGPYLLATRHTSGGGASPSSIATRSLTFSSS